MSPRLVRKHPHTHEWVGHHKTRTLKHTLFCEHCPAEVTVNDPDVFDDLFDHLNHMRPEPEWKPPCAASLAVFRDGEPSDRDHIYVCELPPSHGWGGEPSAHRDGTFVWTTGVFT